MSWLLLFLHFGSSFAGPRNQTGFLEAQDAQPMAKLPDATDLVVLRERLRIGLLRDYDRFRVPQRHSSEPVNLSLYMWPYDILYVREAQGSIKICGWLDMYWTDHFLKWSPAEFGGIQHIVLPADTIWLPRIDIFYSKEDSNRHGECLGCYVRVNHEGRLLRGIYFAYAFPCRINVKYFPFDEQICDLEIANWYLDQSLMDLWPTSDKVDLSVFLANEEWDLANITVLRKSTYYNYGMFPSIVYRIYIKRKPFYYICNLLSPSLIITVTAMIGYHMPAAGTGVHQEKVKMGLTAVLSIFILQLGISDNMPRTSDVVPLISIFYFCLVLLLALAILTSSLIIVVEKQGLAGRPVPHYARRFIQSASTIRVVSSPNFSIAKSSCSNLLTAEYRDGESLSAVGEESDSPKQDALRTVYFRTEFVKHQSPMASRLHPVLMELRQMTGEIRAHLREKKLEEDIRQEWTQLADIIEKVSFVGFMVAIGFCVLLFIFHGWY